MLTRSGKVVETELKSLPTSSIHLISLHRRHLYQDLFLVYPQTFGLLDTIIINNWFQTTQLQTNFEFFPFLTTRLGNVRNNVTNQEIWSIVIDPVFTF